MFQDKIYASNGLIAQVIAVLVVLLMAAVFALVAREYFEKIKNYPEGTNTHAWLVTVATLREFFLLIALVLCVLILSWARDLLVSAAAVNLSLSSSLIFEAVSVLVPIMKLAAFFLMILVIFKRLAFLRRWLEENSR